MTDTKTCLKTDLMINHMTDSMNNPVMTFIMSWAKSDFLADRCKYNFCHQSVIYTWKEFQSIFLDVYCLMLNNRIFLFRLMGHCVSSFAVVMARLNDFATQKNKFNLYVDN